MLRFKIALTVILNSCLFLPGAAGQFNNPAETGSVGVYDDKLHGTRTALGAVYDANQMTCAHKFYPTGSLLQVTRIDNDQSVVVEVNDRLSVKDDEVVRVSKVAAQWLDLDPSQVTIVRIDPLGRPRNAPGAYYNTSPSALNAAQTQTARSVDAPQSYEAVPQQPLSVAGGAPKMQFPTAFGSPAPSPQAYENLAARSIISQPQTGLAARTIPQGYDNLATRGIAANVPLPAAYDSPAEASLRNLSAYYVQVAAFSSYANADRYYQNLLRRGVENLNIMQAPKADGSALYRMRIGPFSNAADANQRKQMLGSEYGLRGLVVQEN